MNSNTSGFYSPPITKELEAQLYISQNRPVGGGDLRIHFKQEEIEARRLATYPDSHANTIGRAGNSQRPIYPMTCGLDGWPPHRCWQDTLRTHGFQPSNISTICLLACLAFPLLARQVFEQVIIPLQEPPLKNLLITTAL